MGRSHHPLRIHDRPPPPELAERYLRFLHPRELHEHPEAFPRITSEALFARPSAPLFLEFGCATGDFLVPLAARTPGANFVGADRLAKPLFRAVHAANEEKLTNVIFLKTDARLLLPLCVPGSLAGVFYHFPHPYHKARNRRSGVFTPDFLAALHGRIAADGYMSVLTDSEEMWQYMDETLRELPQFAVNREGPFRLLIDDGVKSFCHRKWEQRGRRIYRMELYPVVGGSSTRMSASA